MKTYGIFVYNAKTETEKRAFPNTTFADRNEASKFATRVDMDRRKKVYLTYIVRELK